MSGPRTLTSLSIKLNRKRQFQSFQPFQLFTRTIRRLIIDIADSPVDDSYVDFEGLIQRLELMEQLKRVEPVVVKVPEPVHTHDES
jgi:hypothetical protein